MAVKSENLLLLYWSDGVVVFAQRVVVAVVRDHDRDVISALTRRHGQHGCLCIVHENFPLKCLTKGAELKLSAPLRRYHVLHSSDYRRNEFCRRC